MNDGGQIAVSPHRPGIIFCTGNVYNSAYFIGVSHSTDDGATWQHDTIALGTRGWALAFDPTDSNRVYVGGDSAYSHPCLLITTDLGRTWTQSRAGLSGAVYALGAVPGSGTDLYAGTTSGVFKSTDAGATWAATGFTTNTKALVVDPDNPATVYAGTYNQGVSVSTDGGATWTAMNDGLDVPKILSLGLRPGAEPVLFAGTDGGAVFRTDILTGIREQPGSVFTKPCGPATLVHATLRLPGNTPAVLLDATGRKVVDLAPGKNDVRQLGPGVYFIRPEDETGQPVTRKVVIQ